MARARLPWIKFLATWGVFLLLHFSYETFPNVVFKVIGEEGETTFFHMKMLFFAYLFASIVEFLVRRRGLASVGQFISSRMLVAVVYPWLAITLWFTAQALGIHVPVIPWEIVYANVCTAIGIYAALRLEEVLDAARFRPSLHALVGMVFAAALVSYVAFSFATPADFFTTPPEF
ncbi:MAG TPA: hypothetical protein VLH81_01005 [Desulfobacterales bacterium]|nr:hypothetical protein [Desulfobacterales bacterium]